MNLQDVEDMLKQSIAREQYAVYLNNRLLYLRGTKVYQSPTTAKNRLIHTIYVNSWYKFFNGANREQAKAEIRELVDEMIVRGIIEIKKL